MSDEHVKELLSGYLDEALSADERRRVDAHLPGCRDCREELDELRRVSKMVASLPKKDLPPGFLTRLDSRRRLAGARAEAKGTPFAWLPVSPKAAAFAAAAFVAMGVTLHEIRYRLAPSILPGEEESQTAAPLTEAEALDRELARRKRALDAESSWRGVTDGALSASESATQSAAPAASARLASRGAAARREMSYFSSGAGSAGGAPQDAMKKEAAKDAAPAKARLKSDGAPVGETRGSLGPSMDSNESIYAFLQKEKSKMGIQEIISPSAEPGSQRPLEPAAPAPLSPQQSENLALMTPGSAGSSAEGLPDGPMSRAEAMTAVRSMATGLSRMNEDYRWRKSPTVPLESTDKAKPRLLAKAQASRPINAPAAPARSDKAESLTAPLPSEAKALASDDGTNMVHKPAAARRTLRVKRSWSASQGGMGAAGGAVIHRAEDWADMWRRIRFAPELPSADFSGEMAVAVFGERSEEKSRSVEIDSVTEEEGRLLIRFRVKTDESASAPKPSTPYHVVMVPVSGLPFDFVQVP